MSILQNKKIGILGLGISGIACYKKLFNKVDRLLCFDDNPLTINKFIEAHGTNNVKQLDDILWQSLNFIVVSPSIQLNYPKPHYIVDFAKQYGIELISDIDLLYLFNIGKKFIGITGTNGKSTISSLIHHIATNSGLNYALCGNIGIASLSLDDNYDGYIIEISSFQLELIKYLKLDIAIISNITPDHMDRYSSFDSYKETKLRIFDICSGEKIISIDGSIMSRIDLSGIEKLYCISKSEGSYIIKDFNSLVERLADNLLPNKMLMQNYIYAYIVGKILGINEKEILINASSFQPLKHRMEFVGTHNNINFYNDSKATNPDAAIASISSLENIFLLAGGVSKKVGYDSLLPHFKNIKKAYLFGESKNEIADFLQGKIDYHICDNLDLAFKFAIKDASLEKYANILLAPMCSSFDQFKNFEDRGTQFIEMFYKIK